MAGVVLWGGLLQDLFTAANCHHRWFASSIACITSGFRSILFVDDHAHKNGGWLLELLKERAFSLVDLSTITIGGVICLRLIQKCNHYNALPPRHQTILSLMTAWVWNYCDVVCTYVCIYISEVTLAVLKLYFRSYPCCTPNDCLSDPWMQGYSVDYWCYGSRPGQSVKMVMYIDIRRWNLAWGWMIVRLQSMYCIVYCT